MGHRRHRDRWDELHKGNTGGEKIQYGDALFDQNRINLKIKSLLGLLSETVYSQWDDLRINHGGGNLIIRSVKNKNAQVLLSYRDVNNAHILESIINIVQKRPDSLEKERGREDEGDEWP